MGRRVLCVVLVFVVAALHCVGLMLLYPSTRLDLLRFALPTVVAAILYACVLQFSRKRASLTIMFFEVRGLSLLSLWLGMVICVNRFGS